MAAVHSRRDLKLQAGLYLPRHRILASVGIGGWGHIGEWQRRAFPKQARPALAGGVQALQMKGMFSGAQSQRPAVVAHCISRRPADLGKGRAGLSHFNAVYRQARAVAGQQMEGIAAVGGNIN